VADVTTRLKSTLWTMTKMNTRARSHPGYYSGGGNFVVREKSSVSLSFRSDSARRSHFPPLFVFPR
jgi:hypothetical protein